MLRLAAAAAALLISMSSTGQQGCIMDPGLHRQWLVVPDSTHRERPARLIEVPWQEPATCQAAKTGPEASPARGSNEQAKGPSAPLVHPGMRVVIERKTGEAGIRLLGTALGVGSVGDTVWVSAGLGGAALRAVVRGPARLELAPDNGGR